MSFVLAILEEESHEHASAGAGKKAKFPPP
jgi:hypothetical protein